MKLQVKLVRSAIDRPDRQKKTLRALGLTKLNKTVEVEASAQIKGMINTVNHLVEVKEV